jgi:hypothetical protein
MPKLKNDAKPSASSSGDAEVQQSWKISDKNIMIYIPKKLRLMPTLKSGETLAKLQAAPRRIRTSVWKSSKKY